MEMERWTGTIQFHLDRTERKHHCFSVFPVFSLRPFSRAGCYAFCLQSTRHLCGCGHTTRVHISALLHNITRASWYLSKKMAATGQTTLSLHFSGAATSTGEKRPPPAAGRNLGASKHRRTGINPSWVSDFLWLVIFEDDCGEQGKLCSICCKTNCRLVRVLLGKVVWVQVPCMTITW